MRRESLDGGKDGDGDETDAALSPHAAGHRRLVIGSLPCSAADGEPEYRRAPVSLQALWQSPFQRTALIVSITSLLFAGLFLWSNARGEQPDRLAPLWSFAGFLLILGFSLSGHAAAVTVPRLSAIVFDWIHLIAAAMWVGGILYLLLIVFPAAQQVGLGGLRSGDISRIAAERFAAIALTSIGLLIVTGLFSAELRFSSLGDVPRSLYGRTLLLKVAVFLLMGAVAIFHNRILRPRLTRRTHEKSFGWWRRAIALEGLFGVVVVGAVAVMVTAPVPTREVETGLTGIPDSSQSALTLAENAGRTLVTVTAYPLQPGENVFRVRVTDPWDPGLQPEEVDVQLEIEPAGEAVNDGDGHHSAKVKNLREVRQPDGSFVARATLDEPGPWRVTIHVRTPEVESAVAVLTFPVPVPGAKLILEQAARVLDNLKYYKIREDLFDGETRLLNRYELAGKKRMAWHVSTGLEIIFTDTMRYTKPPGGEWEASPAPEGRLGITRYLREASQARLLAISDIDGQSAYEISFFDERISAWMTVWVATDSYRMLRLQMRYPGHYMTWDFYDFDVPNEIQAPI